MAKKLSDYAQSIEELQKKIEAEKKALKEYEMTQQTELGKAYFALLKLDNKDLDVETAVRQIKDKLKQRKDDIKAEKEAQKLIQQQS